MNKLIKIIFLFFFIQISLGQNLRIINDEAIHFSVKNNKDTINFVLIDNKIEVKKPIFLFCQGSLPVPLFVETTENKIWMIGGGITNFDINEIKKHYHLIVISMPKTPLIVNEKNLNKSYCYIPNENEPDIFVKDYDKEDFLENYEYRAKKVLKFLRNQKWVDNSKLIVAGHSQGSKVATLITLNNKKVTHLGLFGANPFGRIDQNIRSYRKEAEMKQITWEKANEEIEKTYQMYKDSYNNEILNKNSYLIAWKSFSRPLINDWLKINIPTYLAYGTNDIASDLCDLVPLFYIQNSKNNLTYKRYLNLEHNFFEVNIDGSINYEKEHWTEVMNGFLKWSLN